MTNSFYASSIRTATDAAGQSFAVWNENGLLLMAASAGAAPMHADEQPINCGSCSVCIERI
jgi:hypothetical protein